VPNPGIYEESKKYIEQHLKSDTKTVSLFHVWTKLYLSLKALVVPSFEALENNIKFPSNKAELLEYIRQNKTIGYRCVSSFWPLSHFTLAYLQNEPGLESWSQADELSQVVLSYRTIWSQLVVRLIMQHLLEVNLYNIMCCLGYLERRIWAIHLCENWTHAAIQRRSPRKNGG
jgi:hypothetical protein